MTSIPATTPPLPVPSRWRRDLPANAALSWLAGGWKDFRTDPLTSLAYGLGVFAISLAIIYSLFALGWDYLTFPALAGFMVVGPALAVGLYEKSRRLALGERTTLWQMLFVRTASNGQVLFIGAVLCGLMLLWMRAAVLLYALFFGLRPFPGLDHIAGMLFTTPLGLALLAVGSLVGALFAAFSFAISAFSVPMLLNEKRDAFTAMGSSMALVWNNLPAMLTWGAIVLALFVLSLATGLIALIVAFPLLGHASWHAYEAVRATP